jgi:dienelactone hydrolase
MGAPVLYLRDLDARDPIAAAKKLTVPMLVLQGERDYQVTMDDFGRWRADFESSSRTTLRSFRALNHHFMAASGQPNPAEYSVPAHVSQEVIDLISTWLKR